MDTDGQAVLGEGEVLVTGTPRSMPYSEGASDMDTDGQAVLGEGEELVTGSLRFRPSLKKVKG